MPVWSGPLALVALLVLLPASAPGVPLLDLAEPDVLPGAAVDVTVLGRPGDYFALVGSPTGSRLTVAGRPLNLGPDAVVLATGRLDVQGRAFVSLTPDFAGGARLHLQAVTAPGPAFEGFTASPSKVLRNASLWLRATRAPASARAIKTDG
jgi:hypothetical protein